MGVEDDERKVFPKPSEGQADTRGHFVAQLKILHCTVIIFGKTFTKYWLYRNSFGFRTTRRACE